MGHGDVSLMLVSLVVAAAGFVSMECMTMAISIEAAMLSAMRQWAMVAVVRIKMIVHVAVESVWSVEPWTRSKEDPIHKPLRSVIAVGGASIRGIVEITVWAYGFRPNIDTDGHLGFCR